MMMHPTKIIPLSLCAFYVAAACVYAYHGDWRRFTYWMAATALNISITI